MHKEARQGLTLWLNMEKRIPY